MAFPKNFLWGGAIAPNQAEGAWNVILRTFPCCNCHSSADTGHTAPIYLQELRK